MYWQPPAPFYSRHLGFGKAQQQADRWEMYEAIHFAHETLVVVKPVTQSLIQPIQLNRTGVHAAIHGRGVPLHLWLFDIIWVGVKMSYLKTYLRLQGDWLLTYAYPTLKLSVRWGEGWLRGIPVKSVSSWVATPLGNFILKKELNYKNMVLSHRWLTVVHYSPH